jgi:ubiquinone/menaquinone biosynthesis C-methylase UbiE
MESIRKPFQGVLNIIRFNWHFYLVASIIIIVLQLFRTSFSPLFQQLILIGTGISIFTILISLIISYYVYDFSDLYQLKWIHHADNEKLLIINAGFDESSEIIQHKFPNSHISICDFYDQKKHTEVSISRARKLYPPSPKTIYINTNKLPFEENTFDKAIAILAAHEIRDDQERIAFFNELNRVTKLSGQILVTEHLRDFNNFMAYTIGFFHFYSRKTWIQTFEQANLKIKKTVKTTPFITTFILEDNGNTL